MFEPTLDAPGDVRRALTWIRSRGISVRPWPPSAPSPDHLEPADASATTAGPTLFILDDSAPPPRCGDLQDWIRPPLQVDELYARADLLLSRARAAGPICSIDEDGVLKVDGHLVIFSITDASIVRVLVENLGQLVTRDEVRAAAWPDPSGPPGRLARHIDSIRTKIAGLPLELHALRGQGLLLEAVESVLDLGPDQAGTDGVDQSGWSQSSSDASSQLVGP